MKIFFTGHNFRLENCLPWILHYKSKSYIKQIFWEIIWQATTSTYKIVSPEFCITWASSTYQTFVLLPVISTALTSAINWNLPIWTSGNNVECAFLPVYTVCQDRTVFSMGYTIGYHAKIEKVLSWQGCRILFCHDNVFFLSWWGERRSKYHKKRAIIGLPAKHHLNGVSLEGWWWPNSECWLCSFVIFRGSRPVLLRNPIFLWFFRGGGVDCRLDIFMEANNMNPDQTASLVPLNLQYRIRT